MYQKEKSGRELGTTWKNRVGLRLGRTDRKPHIPFQRLKKVGERGCPQRSRDNIPWGEKLK